MKIPVMRKDSRSRKTERMDFCEIKNSGRKAAAQSHWITDQTDLGFKPTTLKQHRRIRSKKPTQLSSSICVC